MQPKSGAASKDKLLGSRAASPRQISGAACGGSHHMAALPSLPVLGPILLRSCPRVSFAGEKVWDSIEGQVPRNFSLEHAHGRPRAAPIGQPPLLPPFNSSASAYLGQLVVWEGF
jgi:hypothetical protein